MAESFEKAGQAIKEGVAEAAHKTGEALHKAVDATILSPHGTYVDGAPRVDGALAKDAADLTKKMAQGDNVK